VWPDRAEFVHNAIDELKSFEHVVQLSGFKDWRQPIPGQIIPHFH
jgi:hypothetical protein